jgi:hypothetical protein
MVQRKEVERKERDGAHRGRAGAVEPRNSEEEHGVEEDVRVDLGVRAARTNGDLGVAF